MPEHQLTEHRLCHEDRVLLAQIVNAQATQQAQFALFLRIYNQDQRTMEQALSDAITRAAASEATAGATISRLTTTNATLTDTNATLQEQLAAAQAAAGDPAAEQAAAAQLNSSTDDLDAAVAAAQPA